GRGPGRRLYTLAAQQGRARGAGDRRVHHPARQHQAVARPEPQLETSGAEGDVAVDRPQALVVVVRVRAVRRSGGVVPPEDAEALALELVPELVLDRSVGPGPRNPLEPHSLPIAAPGPRWPPRPRGRRGSGPLPSG